MDKYKVNENENENQNQKNLRNLLHLRKSARREATTYRAEVYANPVEAKTHRAETDNPCAITFFL